MEHYYGDTVRRFFIAGAVIMAATLPFFVDKITEPLPLSIFAIVAVSVAAALTSPRYEWSAALNVLIAVGAVLMFEYYAVDSYARLGADFFFWTNQALALIFLFALYYGIKTARGMR